MSPSLEATIRDQQDDQDMLGDVLAESVARSERATELTFRAMDRKPKRERIAAELMEWGDIAFGEAKGYHDNVVDEQSLYYAGIAGSSPIYAENSRLGSGLTMSTFDTLNNLVFEVTHSAINYLNQATPRPYYTIENERTGDMVEVIDKWIAEYDAADSYTDHLSTMTLHRLVGGLGCQKVSWNRQQDRLTCPSHGVLDIAPHPDASNIDLSDCEFIVERYQRRPAYVKNEYPKFKHLHDVALAVHELREYWLTPAFAAEVGIRDMEVMVRAVLIDKTLVKLEPSPYWFPGFPHVFARGFRRYDASGAPNVFWGFGFPSILRQPQKVLDESIAQAIFILQNMGLGNFFMEAGIVDDDKLVRESGKIIPVNPERLRNKALRDILYQIPPTDMPVALLNWLAYIEGAMKSVSGITEVLTGQTPSGGASGRSINLRQSAALTRLSDLQRETVEYITRLARRKVHLVQQLGGRPSTSKQWRFTGRLDQFPEAARYVGVDITVQDTSDLPQTVEGKIGLAERLLQNGTIGADTFFEITQLDKTYGFDRQGTVPPGTDQLSEVEPGDLA